MMDFGYYNMDCMEGMKQFPDKYFDLAIVDPPYGIGVTKMNLGEGGGLYRAPKAWKRGEWDNKAPSSEWFNELFKISQNQILWGGNYYPLPISSGWIVWDKNNGESDFGDCELAWSSFDKPIRKFKYTWSGFIQEKMGHLKECRIHPTQKPVALYKWLLKNYAKEGDIILDTHVGSASSLIACEDMGFKYVGFELDTDYFFDSSVRLENFRAQLKLAI